jgi:hypothetical protein
VIVIKFAPGVSDEIMFRAAAKARRTGGTQEMMDEWEADYINDLYDFLDQIARFPNSGDPNKVPPNRVLTAQRGKVRGETVIWEVEPTGDILIKGIVDFL